MSLIIGTDSRDITSVSSMRISSVSRGKECCPSIPVPSTSKSRPFSWDTVKDRSSVGAFILALIVDECVPAGGAR